MIPTNTAVDFYSICIRVLDTGSIEIKETFQFEVNVMAEWYERALLGAVVAVGFATFRAVSQEQPSPYMVRMFEFLWQRPCMKA